MLAYIGLGSNLGGREEYLRTAIKMLAKIENVSLVSSIYESDPVDFLDQSPFLNMVIELETDRQPVDLLKLLQEFEKDLHRERSFPNAPRTIDLDVLLYDQIVENSQDLTIPHPRMLERAFVLVPLAEIAPNVVVPTVGKTVKALLDALEHTEGVSYWGEF
jgi:2-amino-4-hydroxy-6-hydroxymethyldihydropteridine diphosphokinase